MLAVGLLRLNHYLFLDVAPPPPPHLSLSLSLSLSLYLSLSLSTPPPSLSLSPPPLSLSLSLPLSLSLSTLSYLFFHFSYTFNHRHRKNNQKDRQIGRHVHDLPMATNYLLSRGTLNIDLDLLTLNFEVGILPSMLFESVYSLLHDRERGLAECEVINFPP